MGENYSSLIGLYHNVNPLGIFLFLFFLRLNCHLYNLYMCLDATLETCFLFSWVHTDANSSDLAQTSQIAICVALYSTKGNCWNSFC